MARDDLLVRTLVELAEGPTVELEIVDYVSLMAQRAVELLAVDEAGVLLADASGTLRLLAASSDATGVLELFEAQRAAGPALDCYLTGEPVANRDLRSDEARRRWPRLTHEAQVVGFSVAHAPPLRSPEAVLGSFALVAASPAPLPGAHVLVGCALADVAAISIIRAQVMREGEGLAERLQAAVRSRAVIEQAKGVLAERAGVAVSEALALLRRSSHLHGRPLSGVAAEVVAGSMAPEEMTSGIAHGGDVGERSVTRRAGRSPVAPGCGHRARGRAVRGWAVSRSGLRTPPVVDARRLLRSGWRSSRHLAEVPSPNRTHTTDRSPA